LTSKRHPKELRLDRKISPPSVEKNKVTEVADLCFNNVIAI